MKKTFFAILLIPVIVLAIPLNTGNPVNAAALNGGRTTEVLVLTSAATAMPASPLAYRKAVLIENLGPNDIYCAFGGSTPLKTGALGHKVNKASEAPLNRLAADVGAGVLVKCIALTADQVTTAATQFTELR